MLPSVTTMQILRDRVRLCYIKEGVNHIQNCKPVSLLFCRGCAVPTLPHDSSGHYFEQQITVQVVEQYLASIKVSAALADAQLVL